MNWSDPHMHPTALALLDRLTMGQFELDHDRHTARLIHEFPAEASHGSITSGVTAQLHPYSDVYEGLVPRDQLHQHPLRLMGYPFNGNIVYRVVREAEADAHRRQQMRRGAA